MGQGGRADFYHNTHGVFPPRVAFSPIVAPFFIPVKYQLRIRRREMKTGASSEGSPGRIHDYLPNRGLATRLYSSTVSTDTITPLTTFRGATHSKTKVVTLLMLLWIAAPMPRMASMGMP